MIQALLNGKRDRVRITGYILISLALVFGFIFRFFGFIRYTTFFYLDQARDAEVYMKMWQGVLPALGPSASVGGYHLPPLYYYLVFPFTIFGADPVFSVIANALLSFLSIPLLIYVVYELLENVEESRRILIAALSGFWYSFLFSEIFISTFHWNPSPIPFFLLCFTWLYKYLLNSKASIKIQTIAWIGYGVLLAILVSLHSTTLFIMPIIFVLSSILFLYKNRKQSNKWFLPGLAIIAAIVSLFPYWRGEIGRKWGNTKEILMTILTSGGQEKAPLLKRIVTFFSNYFELGNQAYFMGNSWFYVLLSFVFLSVVLVVGFLRFKGNKIILVTWSLIWVLYLYAASNFQGINYVHYKLLLLFAPIVFTAIALSYLDWSKLPEKVLIVSLVAGIIFSIANNLSYDVKYLASKYSTQRLVTPTDIVEAFQKIPEKATICTFDPKNRGWMAEDVPYQYIDGYITKRNFKILGKRKLCEAGTYNLVPKHYMVQRTDYLFPDFDVYKNEPPLNSRLFQETANISIYITN